jgi:hypothetical protein
LLRRRWRAGLARRKAQSVTWARSRP